MFKKLPKNFKKLLGNHNGRSRNKRSKETESEKLKSNSPKRKICSFLGLSGVEKLTLDFEIYMQKVEEIF
ncbi:hypothetical protein COU58_02785 [Candidatus Pacearchaeota archaeon CG10_big_fil_rev_8_21_14_0_10_32_42]|nr:MAG: hypothetical protein COU58_02785 [Candidatus Pacearchaeota archaeon CG10_big_fil_rev_8_21_14_0_10_32_42]